MFSKRSRFDPEMWDKRTDGRETVGDTLVMRFTLSRFRLQSLRVHEDEDVESCHQYRSALLGQWDGHKKLTVLMTSAGVVR